LLTYSEDFGAWDINAGGISSIEPNYAISPEGVENAYKVNFVVQGDSDLGLVKVHSVTGGSTYAYSIYIKGEGSDIGKDIVVKSKRSGGDYAGTITTQTLTGEWVRVDFTTTYAANNTSTTFRISSNDATSCLIYGAQAELGNYATSYIPTTTASVTRNRDQCVKTGISSLINSAEGVLYVEINALANDLTFRTISLSSDTNLNRIRILYNTTTNNVSYQIRNTSGVLLSDSDTVTDIKDTIKIAIKYKSTDFAVWLNGVEVATSSSAGDFSSDILNNFSFDNGSGFDNFYGNVKALALWPTALTDDELATLTTI
jgi:hypothetical protein